MSKYKITLGDISEYRIVYTDGESTGWISAKTDDIRIEKENNMSDWKFKAGDVIYSTRNREQYTVIGNCLLYGIENYMVRNRLGISLNISKDVVEDMCELLKPKSLYEQALELLDLKPMEEFMFGGEKYYFDKVGNLIRVRGYENVKEYNFGLENLLFNKDKISKPKSEAELILDELEKVVDKAKVVLERSGR